MKFIYCMIAISLLASCSKKSSTPIITPTPPANPTPVSGVVSGTIKAYDKYGNENVNYSDISIKLIDKQQQVFTGTVNGTGTFRFDNIVTGNVTLAITKPGYGFIDSVKYDHEKSSDTLSNIYLIEELPFSFTLTSAGYSNSLFTFSGNYNYHSTDSYMVSEFLCFNTDPGVSINHTNLLWSPSSSTNVQFLTGTSGGSTSMSFQTLTAAGFKTGDQIYVTLIPSITKFWTSYYNQNNNYTILHYKVSNGSNVVSFTLHQ